MWKERPKCKMVSFVVLVSCLLLMIGCDDFRTHTTLEKNAKKIQPGMSRDQINNLLKDFASSDAAVFSGELKNGGDSFHKNVVFNTNSFVGYDVNYAPSHVGAFSSFEMCTVYYDTNNIVMGYYYNLDH